MSSNSQLSSIPFTDAFNTAVSAHFWHYLMKHKLSENTYRSETVDLRIQEIIQKRGSNSFTSPSTNGWTPSHVAVLAGNKAGLDFLKRRNALANGVKDNDGMTPADLAAKHHPELAAYFRQETPLELQHKPLLSECLGKLFKAMHVQLPNTPFYYCEHTSDFGLAIQSLLLPKPSSAQDADSILLEKVKGVKMAHFSENFTALARKFGFEVQFSSSLYCPRDNLIRLPKGEVIIPAASQHIAAALDCSDSRTLVHGDHASKKTDHDSFQGALGASDTQANKSANDLVAFFGQNLNQLPSLRFYMEGGNAFFLSGSSGKKVLLLGKDSLYIAFNQMRMDKVFEDKHLDMASLTANCRQFLLRDRELLTTTLKEMHSQGLLEVEREKKGLVPRKEITRLTTEMRAEQAASSAQSGCTLLEKAIEQRLYVQPELSEQNIQKWQAKAAEYLAQIRMTQIIIAFTYDVDITDLCLVPQCDYHIDMFLKPGPKGSVFVQDYGFTLALLREIEKVQDQLELTPSDRALLQRYIKTASKLNGEIGKLIIETSLKLKKAGLSIIPTPGVFYDVSSHLDPTHPEQVQTNNLNFLNALSGWSPKTQSYFYIASGAKCGDTLGKILMEAFRQFIQSYQADTQVCFVGHDPENPDDFTEAMQWMNVPGLLLGPHCLTFEIKTASHRES